MDSENGGYWSVLFVCGHPVRGDGGLRPKSSRSLDTRGQQLTQTMVPQTRGTVEVANRVCTRRCSGWNSVHIRPMPTTGASCVGCCGSRVLRYLQISPESSTQPCHLLAVDILK